jgi:hypothetical protein
LDNPNPTSNFDPIQCKGNNNTNRNGIAPPYRKNWQAAKRAFQIKNRTSLQLSHIKGRHINTANSLQMLQIENDDTATMANEMHLTFSLFSPTI